MKKPKTLKKRPKRKVADRRLYIRQTRGPSGWLHQQLVTPDGEPVPGVKRVELTTDVEGDNRSSLSGSVKVSFIIGPEDVGLFNEEFAG